MEARLTLCALRLSPLFVVLIDGFIWFLVWSGVLLVFFFFLLSLLKKLGTLEIGKCWISGGVFPVTALGTSTLTC